MIGDTQQQNEGKEPTQDQQEDKEEEDEEPSVSLSASWEVPSNDEEQEFELTRRGTVNTTFTQRIGASRYAASGPPRRD